MKFLQRNNQRISLGHQRCKLQDNYGFTMEKWPNQERFGICLLALYWHGNLQNDQELKLSWYQSQTAFQRVNQTALK